MAGGGSKKGERRGGRVKGVKNKATIAKEQGLADIVSKAIAAGITPLEVMLDNMRYHHNEALAAQDKSDIVAHRKEAGEAAKDAAPYVHPKLASIEMAGKVEVKTVFTMDITGTLGENAGI